MEKDTYTLNQSMTPGMSGDSTENEKLCKKLEEADDPLIIKQLQRSINTWTNKYISTNAKTYS